MSGTARYYRIALFADPKQGFCSFSWRIKEALEACGHTVMLFTPKLHPYLLDGEGAIDAARLKRFFSVQKLDCLLVADGVSVVGVADGVPQQTAFGVACLTTAQAQAACALDDATRPLDFALSFSAAAKVTLSGLSQAKVIEVAPLADRAYACTPVANTIAFTPGVLVLQDETPDRRAFIDKLRSRCAKGKTPYPIRHAGEGWDGYEHVGAQRSSFAYALRASRAVVLFGEAGKHARGELVELDGLVALALEDGATVVSVGQVPTLHHHDRVHAFDDSVAALDACMEALAGEAEPESLIGIEQRDMLEDVLDAALARAISGHAVDAGAQRPRSVVSVLGYFGAGNFGDEYILETVNDRVRALDAGASVVAISTNPEHTLAHRGIYAVSLEGKAVLDDVLAHSAAALVTAGLLFDQGIRWVMGKAEMLSDVPQPDIPGIAGYVSLAAMNNVRPLLYGIGAGPLDVPDSRRLVAFMGQAGAAFTARDAATADLVRACGVADEQVVLAADTAFLADEPDAKAAQAFLSEHGLDADEQRLVAVSLRDYEGQPADFARRVAVALDIAADRDERVRFIFCLLDSTDKSLSDAVIANMRRTDVALVYDAADDVAAMAGMLSQCWSGVSMRYHASLLLMASGKPCVGIGYLPKVESLFDEMGLGEVLLELDTTADDLYAAMLRVVEGYDELVERVQAGREQMVERAKAGEELLACALRGQGKSKAGFVRRDFYLQDVSAHDLRWQRRAAGAEEAAALRGRIEELEAEKRALAARVEELEQSTSFKLGSALLKVPAACKDALAARKEQGRG